QAGIYVALCGPRYPTVSNIWDCQSSRRDHTRCCMAKGVSETCLTYCDATYGLGVEPAQINNCLNYLNPIRECFWEYLEENPNMYGDL
ncbi:unnamed protein product, partial [Anisakis simplex]|uniref:DB domain-containing protein n=1 Tax=Anisakis simplex TaxID=6269 RepID=A0A0M3KEN1_ANISI